ncbi:MAG: bifunctional glutamate N-acetyltransferase/amino-acid acetyltransferase ArgJ [Actinomycetota bacterium]|jgi:glutamate N-acetyltransferase/amino-acid N-acetyltransferase|nr:bifunctional glutamate N-acetyltransferase/amino-acid acetyltransferase ArgJ [Rubrobacter sp.]MDQ3509476.1 bifunctional glutamate N-acetyltransferase/amino-acid acetyltransferase ArgJ [Actinomycetota bacterium]
MNKNSIIGIKSLSGGALAAGGFMASGVECGVRSSGSLDLGILYSEAPCVSAAVFTRNVLKGAPLTVTGDAVTNGDVRAVVVNSGNANAATGERGVEDARRMQKIAADPLGVSASEVAVASTGVIGEHLPMARVEAGINEAAKNLGSKGESFAEAILTTDTRTKEAAIRVEIGGKEVIVGGTAKGSGMIHPNMGTMLAFLTTDAKVEKECLQKTLASATERTFNRVTVDGDTSPSDMAVFMANGVAGNKEITMDHAEFPIFAEAVEEVARSLAKDIARDGEGATKLIAVSVAGAKDEASAARLAKSIVGSNLVKAAAFGEDANWGRALNAMGCSGVGFDPAGVCISFGEVEVFKDGEPAPHDIERANAALSGDEVVISVRMGEGDASAEAWGCDLTYGYVEINGSYRT